MAPATWPAYTGKRGKPAKKKQQINLWFSNPNSYLRSQYCLMWIRKSRDIINMSFMSLEKATEYKFAFKPSEDT